ncbi:MAG TPA: TlpA disulfide reductase family protein [Candidatus Polarisedimenticolaceae bacterium]|nr:TlpA disulfide reductase family protein [Candidatus Polarisedimenticolaceae bacterium]
MPIVAAVLLAAAAAAPAPRPADSKAVLDEVHRAGASAVMLNVWATWCMPCREEFPDLIKAARELAPKGLRLVLVSADMSDSAADVKTFLTEQGVDFPTFIQAETDQKFIDGLDRRWTGSIPATFLYGKDGKLVRYWEGKADYATIKKRAEAALASKEAP